MNRRRFVSSAALGSAGFGAAVALPAPALAQSPPEVQWRLASSFPKTLATLNGGVEHLCARVAALTDNRFQISPSAAGELAPPLAVLDAVQAGTVDIGYTSLSCYVGKEAAFGFAAAIPFGLTSRQQMAWLYHGGGLGLINGLLNGHGCLGIPAGNTGTQLGGWFRKEIKTPDDFKGLKIGIAGLAGHVIARMGGVPQLLAGGDLAAAFEKRSIDAAAWVGPHDDEKLGLNKIGRIAHTPGWWAGNETLWAIINLDKWRDLPPTYKATLEAACSDACLWVQARYDAGNPPALRRLVANGTQLRPFPPDVLQAAHKASLEVCADFVTKNPMFKQFNESWQAFRDAEYPWFRSADYRFETFVYGQPTPARK